MFGHAIIALDFAPANRTVVSCLPELVRLGTQRVTLVHVLHVAYPRAPETEHLKHYHERLEAIRRSLESDDLAVEVELRIGRPAVEIMRAAKTGEATLLVIGSHGHSVIGQTLLGSVAQEILKHAILPVLVMRIPQERGEEHPLPGRDFRESACSHMTRHVLFATDFSPHANLAFNYVEGMAERGLTRFTILHVHHDERPSHRHDDHDETPDQRPDLAVLDEKQANVEALGAQLKGKGAKDVRAVVRHGTPRHEVLAEATEQDASMIVLGRHGRGLLSDLFLGSVSHHVMQHTPVPVLLVQTVRGGE